MARQHVADNAADANSNCSVEMQQVHEGKSHRNAWGPFLLLSNGFQPEYELGYVNGLAQNGVEPLLVCSDAALRQRMHAGVRTLNLRGSQDPHRSGAAKALNVLRYWWRTSRLIVSERPAVVHTIGLFTLPSSLVAILEALALRVLAKRYLLTVHNLLPHGKHGLLDRFCYRLIYRLPHMLVVHTQRMATGLQEGFGVEPGRIVVMEHGIDRIQPPSAASRGWLRQRFGIQADRPVVLFFGAVAPYKGLDVLIDAFAALGGEPPPALVIAGRCRDDALRRELRDRLESLQQRRIAFWYDAYVPEDEVALYFHGADLLAMPYRHIDQSGVVFMALATGLPVVATDVGALGDYVPLTGGTLTPPGDAAGLAAALTRTIGALHEIDRQAVVGRAERFLWRHTVAPVVAAYRRQD